MTWESSERALARKCMFFCWVLSRRIGERRCGEHLRYVRAAITVISGDWEALQTLGLSAAMPGCPVIRPPNGCQTEAPPATGAVTHAHSRSLPSRTAGPFSALFSAQFQLIDSTRMPGIRRDLPWMTSRPTYNWNWTTYFKRRILMSRRS